MALVTYTNEAADTARRKMPELTADTIYKLTWPWVRDFAPKVKRPQSGKASWSQRRIKHEFDPALSDYADAAPSRRRRTELDAMAERLHAWDGDGAPPFDLKATPPVGPLGWVLPLARFVASDTVAAVYDELFVDEAQDMGSLELAAALRLLRPGGRLTCYGDPGQAIFASAKGIRGDQLPAAWRLRGERRLKAGGHRVGRGAAEAASRVLRPLWDRPAASFRADHETPLIPWRPAGAPPDSGLIMGYSRHMVEKAVREWAMRDVAVVPSLAGERPVVCTGHAAKGAEADDVFILPWSRQALARLDASDPGALRLLYVMLTRGRYRVHVPETLLARIS